LGIGRRPTGDMDYGGREDSFLWGGLIKSPSVFSGVRRPIDGWSPMTYMREQLREKSGAHCVGTLVIPVARLSRFIGETGPTRNSRREVMGQIDIFFTGERFLNFPKRRIICEADY